jgi:hypothetical protein
MKSAEYRGDMNPRNCTEYRARYRGDMNPRSSRLRMKVKK